MNKEGHRVLHTSWFVIGYKSGQYRVYEISAGHRPTSDILLAILTRPTTQKENKYYRFSCTSTDCQVKNIDDDTFAIKIFNFIQTLLYLPVLHC